MTKVLMLLFLVFVLCTAPEIQAQTTEFTFQGSLRDNAVPSNGNYDFEFALFDALEAGGQIGATVPRNNVPVANGIFSVRLDFGSVFPGADRFMEIRVRLAGQPSFTLLVPRQLVNSAPYSVKSLSTDNAATATNSLQLGGVAANQYVVTTDPRMTDARDPLPNSANYIWNQNSVLQTSSNFIISGDGQAGGRLSGNIVNATTQYNIGGGSGSRILSSPGNSLFAGIGAGSVSTGINNSFFGRDAGGANTEGLNNSFFGRSSGLANTTGSDNSFFGAGAGDSNTDGSANSFFGWLSGDRNTTGDANSFFGWGSGGFNADGNFNSFFGRRSGVSNTDGSDNSFFGRDSGFLSTTGSNNTFFGALSGNTNTTGSNNTVVGQGADVSIGALNFATAIGSDAVVTSSARVQLGRNGIDTVRIGELSAAVATQLCINSNNVLSACSSSGRYKENIRPFASGLNLVKKLRPVTFDWIEQKEPDLGLIAEEVAEVEPLLVTHNKTGAIEGVKYDQLSVVLINAVKELQTQIEAQQKQIETLTLALCSLKAELEICKQK